SPEELAESAFTSDTAPPDFAAIADKKPKAQKRRSLKHLFEKFQKLNKKQKALVIISAAIVLAGIMFAIWFFVLHAEPSPQPAAPQVVEPPKPTTEPSRLTGLQVDPDINKRHVTGVMIENSPDARPQSGLQEADIVFEAIAEAGITRFLALYQDTEPKHIGPIRSARPYYLDFLMPFDAGYAHVGGSPTALQQIRQLKIKDLDQFANSGAYE